MNYEDPSDFYTVPLSEAGIKTRLLRADGSDSGQWLLVCGPDSAQYARSVDEITRAVLRAQEIKDEAERDAFSDEAHLRCRAMCVIGWSFAKPFTPDNVREFLRKAPTVARQIEAVAADRKRFFGPGSTKSTDGQTSNDASEAAAGNSHNAASA